MAIAELARVESPHADVLEEARETGEAQVRLEVHDASRLEWSISIPLPDANPLSYAIDVELEIPSNAFGEHAPWDQLQSFTRLDGPELSAGATDPFTIDGLRRHAVAVAAKLARASDAFARHCLLAGSLFAVAPRRDLADGLVLWLEVSRTTVKEARAAVAAQARGADAVLSREHDLADEYMSVRLLDMLAGAERSLAQIRESKTLHLSELAPDIARAEEHLGVALSEELEHRRQRGWICGDAASPEALERYIDRASRLKKHFQEVLFLEPETYRVADRLHHWVASIAAVLASTWAIVIQMFLAHHTSTAETRLGSGLVLVIVLAGLAYAAKDRIKEVGRAWISGNVHRFYAQRVARYRAPARRLPSRDVVVAARESCEKKIASRPDPLNPESGACIPVTTIRHTHRGKVFPRAELGRQGVRRIKHVFRYDLSPLFARLDDAVKPVPVLDPQTHLVRFASAPRCYRVPVRVRVSSGGESSGETATLVLTKRGLGRLEREAEPEPRELDLF